MGNRVSQGFHRLNLGITTCYVLECSRGYLLIDTAYPKDFVKFMKALNSLGIGIDEIRYLLLTHHHNDHAGFAAQLVEQTGCTVIVHEDAILPLRRGQSEDTIAPVNHCIRAIFSLFRVIHREFNYPPLALTKEDRIISGDDLHLLKGIGIDGTILHTPGHSRDSISVVLSDGSAFVGDAAMNFLNLCCIRYRPIFIDDIDMVFESWQKLTEHGAERIFPAHGNPFPAENLMHSRNKFCGYDRRTVKRRGKKGEEDEYM